MPSSSAHNAIPSYWRYGLAVLASFLIVQPAAIILRRLQASFLAEPGSPRTALQQASALDPANDAYPIRIAQLDQDEGRDPLPAWRHALSLNPRSDLTLTQAAIAAELSGRSGLAEQLLLQAARFNHLWLPRWSLANFYFRRGDSARTLHWAALALQRSYGDRTALFRLCLEAGASPDQLLLLIRPGDLDSLASYTHFLAGRGDVPPAALEASAIAYLQALSLAGAPPAAYLTPPLAAINALLTLGQPTHAVRLWNALAARRLHPYPTFDPSHPLTNPGFAPPLPGGFDWRIAHTPGIESYPGVPEGGIKFLFAGTQPESATLLEQWILLRGGRTWELSQESQTFGLTADGAGLFWTLQPLSGGAALTPLRAESLVSDDWKSTSTAWTLPGGDALYRLTLEIRRPTGHPRAEGEIRLRAFALRESQP